MATKVHLRSEFNVGARECMALMSNPELHQELSELKGIARRTAKNMKLENGIRTWQVDVRLLEKAPGFIKDLVSDDQLKWVQKFRMDVETLEMEIAFEHPLPERVLKVSGRVRVVDLVPNEKSAVEVDLAIESGLPLVGRRFEALLADRLTKMTEADFAIRRAYVEQNRGRLEAFQVPVEQGA